MTTMTTDARVWIACLSCYNDGRLVGDWFAAETADDVTLAEVHANAGGERVGCEELWVFDHEGLPITGECSPADAALWGQMLADVDDFQRGALTAWVRSGNYITDHTGTLPSLSDFEDAFAGEWPDFREYADELVNELGILNGIPEEVARYFDFDAWARDLAYDYTTEPAPGGCLFIFRSL